MSNNDVINCYHGSPNHFEEFCFDHFGEVGGNIGAGCGMYFSTSKADAATYGPVIYECLLRLGMAISNHDLTLRPYDVSRICSAAGHVVATPAAKGMLRGAKADTDVVAAIVRVLGLSVKEITDALAACGYTHTEDHLTPEDPDMPHWIVYDLSKVTINGRTNIGHD